MKTKGSIPAVHVVHMAELAKTLGVSRGALFDGVIEDVDALAAPGARVDLNVINVITKRALEMTGEPGLGFMLGMQMRASAHGYLGFAAMTAETLDDALQLAIRYAPIRTDAIALRRERGPTHTAIIVDELVDLGEAREPLLLALVVGLWQIGEALGGKPLCGEAEISVEQPEYAARFLKFAPGEVRFGRPDNRVLLANELLDTPVANADPAAQQLAREQCERELSALGQGLLVTRVRRLARNRGGSFRTCEETARALGMSARTLKRKLQAEGTSYTTLVDGLRRDQALTLLRQPQLRVAEVAERLGYSDTANFTRAFKRWTGQSPRIYRKGDPDS